MMAALLIGRNLVREQRIVLYVFLGWIIAFGLLFSLMHRRGEGPEDLEMLFRQQAAYGVLFALFTSASALHSERRSRRIIAVLSKGIHRVEYLCGLLAGIAMLIGIYFLALGALNQFFAIEFGFRQHLWATIAALWLASVLGAAVALVFATFMPPFVAMFMASLVVAAPYAAAAILGEGALLTLPVAYVLQHVYEYSFATGWTGGAAFAWIAVAEIVGSVFLAARCFRRREVTLAVE